MYAAGESLECIDESCFHRDRHEALSLVAFGGAVAVAADDPGQVAELLRLIEIMTGAEAERLRVELAEAQRVCESLAARVAAQSWLLSKRAEK